MLQLNKRLLCTFVLLSSATYMIGYSLAASEDEALNELFDFLPKGFLEKPVVLNGGRKSKSQHEPINTKSNDILNAAQSIVSGLDSIVKGLNSPENGNCLFKCKNGEPVARKGFKPVPNGCGSHGIKADVSEFPGITECCNLHDICYGTCNSGQAACDRQFQYCMDQSCFTMKSSGVIKNDEQFNACKATGTTFYLTVMNFGCEFYRKAQRDACECPADDAAASGASGSAGFGGSQDRINQYNSEKRTRDAVRQNAKSESAKFAKDILQSIDLSSLEFDLPEAVDRPEL